jgi:hypothetical protein
VKQLLHLLLLLLLSWTRRNSYAKYSISLGVLCFGVPSTLLQSPARSTT